MTIRQPLSTIAHVMLWDGKALKLIHPVQKIEIWASALRSDINGHWNPKNFQLVSDHVGSVMRGGLWKIALMVWDDWMMFRAAPWYSWMFSQKLGSMVMGLLSHFTHFGALVGPGGYWHVLEILCTGWQGYFTTHKCTIFKRASGSWDTHPNVSPFSHSCCLSSGLQMKRTDLESGDLANLGDDWPIFRSWKRTFWSEDIILGELLVSETGLPTPVSWIHIAGRE